MKKTITLIQQIKKRYLCVPINVLVKKLMVCLAFVIFILPTTAWAIARDYPTEDSGLQTGMVVSLTQSGSGGQQQVERASRENSDRTVGIVTTLHDSLVTVKSGNSKVLVESSGQTEAYVSDIGGTVRQGDQLIISPLKGILMKAEGQSAKIIGIAAGTPKNASAYAYKDNDLDKKTSISKIQVDLNVLGHGSGVATSDSALAKLGRTVAGKDVNEFRVLVAVFLFVTVLIAECSIVYGAVSSALTAFGRNPMARKTIRMELIRILLIALAVLAIGMTAVYSILSI